MAEPRDGGDEDDTVDHGALDILYQTVRNEDEAHHCEPEGGILHGLRRAHDGTGSCTT